MSESLSDVFDKNKMDPIQEVCFIRASGEKVSISIKSYHESLNRMFEEFTNAQKKN